MAEEFQDDNAYFINQLNARIRSLESKYNLMGERLLIVNENMIEEYKKISREIKTIDTELKELKRDIIEIKEAVNSIVKELEKFARLDNVKVLEKYINMWNPLKFATEQDVISLIEKKLGGKRGIR